MKVELKKTDDGKLVLIVSAENDIESIALGEWSKRYDASYHEGSILLLDNIAVKGSTDE